MQCPSCQFENPATAKFCQECGSKLIIICPNCQAELPPTAKFCSECGTPLAGARPSPSPPPSVEPPAPVFNIAQEFQTFQQALPDAFRQKLLTQEEGENRIVTVLFADMSESVRTTADMHPEEAATLVNSLLKEMVSALLQYDGRVDRFLGDGMLAVFGAPQAHESDPERAIYAALEMQKAAGKLGFGITCGINTGEVYVGGIGSEQHQEVTVMGSVVNLAARLQARAEAGQVLVGEATYRHTRRAFTFTPQVIAIKGLTQPVNAYLVESSLARPEKNRGIEGLRADIVGREKETETLRECLSELRHGRGQIVSLIGEAGVGKSRLIAELKQMASAPAEEEMPPLWLEGRCLELSVTASYWLFIDMFREYFGFQTQDDDLIRGERIRSVLDVLVAQGELKASRREEIAPLLGHLLSAHFGDEWDSVLENTAPEQIKHQMFIAIRDFVVTLAQRQPVILILEDLHWADSLSLDLIMLFMETLTRDRLLLICAYRPDRENRCWMLGKTATRKCPERYTELMLSELNPSQVRRLIEGLLTINNLPESVKEMILEKSRGNPFFVEEVVRSLVDSGMVYREGDGWRAKDGIEDVAVPESVQSIILTRVDRLGQDLKHVLESAAVIGRLFYRRLLALTIQHQTELENALWQLEDQALIYRERMVPEEEYSFKHVLTQETIYHNILRRRRTGFHQQIAEAIESLHADGLENYYEQLATHYDLAGILDKAVAYMLKAGEKARCAYLNEEAIRYLQTALERLEKSDLGATHPYWHLKALQELGRVYNDTGRLMEAETYFRQAIALGREMQAPLVSLIPLYHWLGEVYYWQARYQEMQQLGEEGLRLVGEEKETVEAALINDVLQLAYGCQGYAEQYRAAVLRNVRFLHKLPYSDLLRTAYIHIVDYYAGPEKNLDEAKRWLQVLHDQAEQGHDLRALAEQYNLIGLHLCEYPGDVQGAITYREQALAIYARIGDTREMAGCHAKIAELALKLGDLEKAETHIGPAMELAETVGRRELLAWSCATLGTLRMCRGQVAEASAAFERFLHLLQEQNYPWLMKAQCPLGQMYLIQGRRQEALDMFLAAMAIPTGKIEVDMLGLVDDAMDDPAAFRAYCDRLRADNPEAVPPAFTHFYLEPATLADMQPVLTLDDFNTTSEVLPAGWRWEDASGASGYRVQAGIEIETGWGLAMWAGNANAPRVLRSVSGDFAFQAACLPVSSDRAAVGGLLLWQDTENYLLLEKGALEPNEIVLTRGIKGQREMIGRGRLPASRVALRLERVGIRIRALCSEDEKIWWTVGETDFEVPGPLEAGCYAVGNINRLVYPNPHPDLPAIRFETHSQG